MLRICAAPECLHPHTVSQISNLTQARTRSELVKLYARRLGGILVYVSLQAAGWTGIVVSEALVSLWAVG
jgi:hypothetical protein